MEVNRLALELALRHLGTLTTTTSEVLKEAAEFKKFLLETTVGG